jgi:lysozyme family protein
MKSAAFLKVVALVLEHEGGFQAKESDRGNWVSGIIGKGELRGTNMGISAMRYPHEDIKGMTRARAIELYHADFWLAVRGDELPVPLAVVTFDAAVNCGPERARLWLQHALTVPADGKIGPATLHAASAAKDPVKVAARATRFRLQYYVQLKGFAEWGAAWIQRSLDTFRLAVEPL